MSEHLESFGELGIDEGAWDDGASESAAWDDGLDLDLDRAVDGGYDPTEGFYSEWEGPNEADADMERYLWRFDDYPPVDFLPPFDSDDIPF